MKGIYLSVFGLSLVNLIQFLAELREIDNSLVLFIKVVGFIILVTGAILSYKQGKTIEILFSDSEFSDGKFIVPFDKFKKKLPVVSVYRIDDEDSLELIVIDVKYRSNNDIVIGKSAVPFNGKAFIK